MSRPLLRELDHVRQDPGASHRRWFAGDALDLIVWTDAGGRVTSFQLYLHSDAEEWGIAWRPGGRLGYFTVDTGEGRPFSYKASPILVPAPPRDLAGLESAFRNQCEGVDEEVARTVLEALRGEIGERAP